MFWDHLLSVSLHHKIKDLILQMKSLELGEIEQLILGQIMKTQVSNKSLCIEVMEVNFNTSLS